MEKTLASVDPWRSGGLETTLLKNTMDDAARRILAGELKAAPTELRLRLSIGNVYKTIAEFQDAHNMLDPTVDLVPPGDQGQRANVLGIQANPLHFEGRLDEALARYQARHAIYEQLHAESDIAASHTIIADCLRKLGRCDEALTHAQTGLQMSKGLYGDDHA